MSLFRRLLNPRRKKQESPSENPKVSKYFPEERPPMDEEFVLNFRENGGKFLYCKDMNEVYEMFNSILLENDWFETEVCSLNKELSKKFDGYNLDFKASNNNASFMLSTCESLVADNGSILLSSNQLKGKKLWELPNNMVIFATTSQIVRNISDGMRIIKRSEEHTSELQSRGHLVCR